jgi:hypothetical protein
MLTDANIGDPNEYAQFGTVTPVALNGLLFITINY